MTQNEIGAKIARSEAAPGVAMNQEMMDLRVYKTRRNIKNTLLSLLEQKPLEDVTITELCGAAMINRKTFYRHYSAVNAVLADIENDLVEDFLRVMRDKDTSCLEAFKILDCIQEFVLKLQQLDDGTRNTILRLAAFAAAIGPVLLMVGKLTAGVGKGMQAISSMGHWKSSIETQMSCSSSVKTPPARRWSVQSAFSGEYAAI